MTRTETELQQHSSIQNETEDNETVEGHATKPSDPELDIDAETSNN